MTVRYVSRPNCLAQKNPGDSTVEKQDSQISRFVKKAEDINNIISNASMSYMHDNNAITYADIAKKQSEGLPIEQDCKNHSLKNCYKACLIPDKIEFESKIGQKMGITKTTRAILCNERRALLDIIKKSQQRLPKLRTWGEIQSVKSFSRKAKQKILEAGAVVDKHSGVHGSYELTLTIPGSGKEVYEVVSRWSGWLVNLQTQVIRRLEKKGLDVYWFFVWEHQKRGALHQHWCISVPNEPMISDWLCRKIRAKWYELLEVLSVKTGIDLFRKRGLSGTWRHASEVWQSNIAPVRKSVAAYFSKYCSKNAETSRYNKARRFYAKTIPNLDTDWTKRASIYTLCPSRYWGSSRRVKRLCAQYRVSISFSVASSEEGDYIYQTIYKWVANLSDTCKTVSRSFEVVGGDAGFIYCKGWERKIWFAKDALDAVFTLFQRIRANEQRKVDPIGALVDIGYF